VALRTFANEADAEAVAGTLEQTSIEVSIDNMSPC
jgi:hypothetical protein